MKDCLNLTLNQRLKALNIISRCQRLEDIFSEYGIDNTELQEVRRLFEKALVM